MAGTINQYQADLLRPGFAGISLLTKVHIGKIIYDQCVGSQGCLRTVSLVGKTVMVRFKHLMLVCFIMTNQSLTSTMIKDDQSTVPTSCRMV